MFLLAINASTPEAQLQKFQSSAKMLFIYLLAILPLALAASHKRSITCLQVGSTATASWTNSAGQKCTFTGVVGSNYGPNPSGSGEYVLPSLSLSMLSNRIVLATRVTVDAVPDVLAAH